MTNEFRTARIDELKCRVDAHIDTDDPVTQSILVDWLVELSGLIRLIDLNAARTYGNTALRMAKALPEINRRQIMSCKSAIIATGDKND